MARHVTFSSSSLIHRDTLYNVSTTTLKENYVSIFCLIVFCTQCTLYKHHTDPFSHLTNPTTTHDWPPPVVSIDLDLIVFSVSDVIFPSFMDSRRHPTLCWPKIVQSRSHPFGHVWASLGSFILVLK